MNISFLFPLIRVGHMWGWFPPNTPRQDFTWGSPEKDWTDWNIMLNIGWEEHGETRPPHFRPWPQGNQRRSPGLGVGWKQDPGKISELESCDIGWRGGSGRKWSQQWVSSFDGGCRLPKAICRLLHHSSAHSLSNVLNKHGCKSLSSLVTCLSLVDVISDICLYPKILLSPIPAAPIA